MQMGFRQQTESGGAGFSDRQVKKETDEEHTEEVLQASCATEGLVGSFPDSEMA